VNKLATILCISTALLFPPTAQAWSGAGHQVIAAEAYCQLPSPLQKKVTEILKAHPDYQKWEKSFASESGNLDLPTFIFMRSSTWADEIRRGKSPYNHPKWHYVDYPLNPPKFPLEPGPDPTDDILYGIGQCEKILADTKATPEERAVYLSWLIHLIGDMHQPLHCCFPSYNIASATASPICEVLTLRSLGTPEVEMSAVRYPAEITFPVAVSIALATSSKPKL
jgi:hypothetical protein